MLARIGAADSLLAGRRVVPAGRVYRALLGSGGREASAGSKDGERALRGAQRGSAAEAGSAGHSSSAECCDATWSELKAGPSDEAYAHAQPAPFAVPARAQHICEAYRATDPVLPRPGLYLHVRA
jgi:hypothetical protein